jgi:plastocyanin
VGTLAAMKIAPVLLLVLALLLPACEGDGAPPEPCTDPTPATSVELADFAFRPDCLSVDAGATIALENSGDAPHTFTVEGTELDVNMDAGGSDEVRFDGVDPGTYAVTCTFHPQMEATITVG